MNTLELMVNRDPTDGVCTLGELLLNDIHQCFTLEPPVREVVGEPVAAWKVFGDTAIPAGRYQILITFSPHFQKNLPEYQNVPGFTGVRMHAGNEVSDTEACTLVGETKAQDSILQSVLALEPMQQIIQNSINNNVPVFITFNNAAPQES